MKTMQGLKSKFLYHILFLLSGNCFASEGMPQFNANSFNSQLFWLLISFALLYLTINYFILPRIRENIRLRKNKIANDIERANSIKAEIEKLIAQSNIKLEDAKNQSQKIIKETLIRSNKEYENQIDNIKKQIASMHLKNERRIADYKKNLEKDLEKSAISLCMLILGRLNYKGSTPEQMQKILSKFSMSDNV